MNVKQEIFMPNTSITNLPLNTSYPKQANQQCVACQPAVKTQAPPVQLPVQQPSQAPVQANLSARKDPILKYSPVTIGLTNFAAWTGLGYLLDRGFCKIIGSSTSKKGSVALSGVIGLCLGYSSYKMAKNIQKEANTLLNTKA